MMNVAAITNVLNQEFSPVIADLISRSVPILKYITVSAGGGKNISWDVRMSSDHAAGSYDETTGATMNTGGATVTKPAFLQWKMNKAEFSLTGKALAVAASSGPNALSKLLSDEVGEAKNDLVKAIGAQIYADGTGNSGKDIDGLAAAIDVDNTYATLDRSQEANAPFRSNVLGNSGVKRDVTKALMDEMERIIFEKADGRPIDLIITTPAIVNKYEDLFDTNVRVNQGDARDVGVKQVSYKGIPIERDANCPAGTMYFLNTSDIEFEQLPAVEAQEGLELTEGDGVLRTAEGDTAIQVVIELLGKTGDAYPGFMKVYGNLVLKHPNWHGRLEDLQ